MIMAKRKKIADLIPGSFTGTGLFSAMINPIWCKDFDPKELDIYFISNYGEKWAAPYLMHISDGDILTNEKISEVANTIYSIYKGQWEHLYNAYKAEYNPIHNTDATEIEKINKVGNEDNTFSNTMETSSSTSSDTDGSESSSTDNKRSGFNSNNNVNDTSGTASNTNSVDVDTSSNVESSGENTELKNNTENIERETRKFGNIGVMTSAQLIGGEISLWRWNYIKSVMSDISDMIALSIY